MKHSALQELGAATCVALLALLAFMPAVRNGFVFDDVAQTIALEPANSFVEWIASAAEPWWPREKEKRIWRPVTRLLILGVRSMADKGDALPAWPLHLTGVLLHAAGSALTFLLARRIGLGLGAAFFAAAVLAVHPLRSEAVHQIVGQADLLATFFMTAGLLLLIRGIEREWTWWNVAFLQGATFALAIGSKENAVVYPFLALAAVIALSPKSEWRNRAMASIVITSTLVLGLFLAARIQVVGGIAEARAHIPIYENPLAAMTLARRIPAALGIFGFFIAKSFVPIGLSPDYAARSLPFESGWGWLMAWFGGLMLAMLVVLAAWSFLRNERTWALSAGGLFAYFITGNLFFVVGVSAAERLWYFPLVPLAIGVAFALERALASKGSRTVALSTAAVLLLLISATWKYAPAWRTPTAHAMRTLKVFPDSSRAHYNLAREYYIVKDFQKGLHHARRAAELRPDDAEAWGYVGLHMTFLDAERPKAEAAFQRALELDPNLDLAAEHYANWLVIEKRYVEALPFYEQRLRTAGPEDRARVLERITMIKSMRRSNANERLEEQTPDD